MQLIDQLQQQRVSQLVQLSVCTVRLALAGPIADNLNALHSSQPGQSATLQHHLRSQILLNAIMGDNALLAVDDAFIRVECLERKHSN